MTVFISNFKNQWLTTVVRAYIRCHNSVSALLCSVLSDMQDENAATIRDLTLIHAWHYGIMKTYIENLKSL